MNCVCDEPGFCETYQRIQNLRDWQICRGEVLTPEKCAVYRANWTRVAAKTGRKSQADCIHRGSEIRREGCATCQGTVLVKVFACALFSECTLAKPLPSIAPVCQSCPHYEAPATSSADNA